MDTVSNILGLEGTGQNPYSSAVGPGQFLNSTWLSTIKKYRPDLVQGLSNSQILGLRTRPPKSDPGLGAEMTADYAKDNDAYLSAHGLPVTPGNTYLAHLLGPGGAAAVLTANPSAPLSGIVGSQVVAANPFMKGMTAQQLQAWAGDKMNGGQNGQGTPLGAGPQVSSADAASTQGGHPAASTGLPQGAASPPVGGAPWNPVALRQAVQAMQPPQVQAPSPLAMQNVANNPMQRLANMQRFYTSMQNAQQRMPGSYFFTG